MAHVSAERGNQMGARVLHRFAGVQQLLFQFRRDGQRADIRRLGNLVHVGVAQTTENVRQHGQLSGWVMLLARKAFTF